MRVVAGSAKGRKLKNPSSAFGKRVRPLTDGTREALFNILQPYIEGKDFLDLFAGTGAVGIEALSRGARLAIFVEMDKRVAQMIRENLATTGFTERGEIYTIAVDRALKLLHRQNALFDFVFLGPPYATQLAEETLKELVVAPVLRPGATIVAEHTKRVELSDEYGSLHRTRQKEYGDTVLSFYNWPLDSARGKGE